MARAAVIVTLGPGDEFPVRKYPAGDRDGSKPHVSIDLVDVDNGSVWVTVFDPVVLGSLLGAVAQARDWLSAEAAGQSVLPVEAEPVGDTGLTLHPLPVGEA